MSGQTAPAAYHGSGFQARAHSHGQDVAAGRFWSSRAVDSEYRPLREVVLGVPDPRLNAPARSDTVRPLRPVDYAQVEAQVSALARCYEWLGISVHLLRAPGSRDSHCAPDLSGHNLMFARDLFFATPEGVIVARMGGEVRAGEPRHAARLLASLEVPVLRTVHGTGTLEGSDVLWAREDTVLVGVGNRSNAAGVRHLAGALAELGVQCVQVPLPRGVPHLLGLVRIVDHDLALVRGELLPAPVQHRLRTLGLTLVSVPEHPQVTHRHGMDVVCVAPRTVVMPAEAPIVRTVLREAGIHVAAQIAIDDLLAAGGGIGRATGILARETAVAGPEARH